MMSGCITAYPRVQGVPDPRLRAVEVTDVNTGGLVQKATVVCRQFKYLEEDQTNFFHTLPPFWTMDPTVPAFNIRDEPVEEWKLKQVGDRFIAKRRLRSAHTFYWLVMPPFFFASRSSHPAYVVASAPGYRSLAVGGMRDGFMVAPMMEGSGTPFIRQDSFRPFDDGIDSTVAANCPGERGTLRNEPAGVERRRHDGRRLHLRTALPACNLGPSRPSR